jgi:hypothetical protein
MRKLHEAKLAGEFLPETMRTEEVLWSIMPILHGEGPEVQGAVLVELLAMYLAGHIGPDATEMREWQIKTMLKSVRELVPLFEARIIEQMRVGGNA